MSLVRKTATSLILSSILLFITPIKTFAFEPLSSWSQQQSLPYSIASHVSTINNNKLSIIGGATNFSTSEISQTEINNVGNLTTWQTFQNLTSPLFWNSIAKNENFVYLLGGSINTSTYPTNTVYVGTNNLQNWSTTTPLSSPLALGNSIIVNNKIYYSGGGLDSNFTSISSKVYVADINPDGTLGSWAETTPLPEPLFGHGMIETGSKIIIIGGRTSMWYSNPRVYEATINPNGTLGTWTQTNSLPTPISRAGVIKKGNIIYVVGGESLQGPGSITFLKKVYYTTVDQNASIGPWLESQYELPQPLCCGSLATTDTNMYYTGGHNSTGYLNTVYMSSIGNSLPSLIVPDIKQYSSPWNSQIYDSANNWYPSNPTIERWGCALTSAAMVLNYFNHQIDPGVLNTWLKAQPDGYIRNGLLNWLSVSRYTLQHNSSSSPTLEYKRQDTSYLVPELTESRPAILEEPGHFVVAKSQLPTTFGINDPAYSNRPTLESYNNSFLSLGSYIPSHTDLSYIYLLIDPAFKIEVFDPAGNKIEGFSFTSQPITDNFSLQTSGTPLNT
ncbi:MAG TPA: C39 family peptidase, partial [Patescibacteria group bacterium]